MKKENNIIKICGSMCFILCMICSVYTYPSMAQEMKSITFSKKLTREEAAAFKEPDNTYEDENGIRYLDYVKQYGKVSNQVIRFGENLLDLKKYSKAEDIKTAIIPLGAVVDNKNVDIKAANGHDGTDYVYNQEAVNLYGWIYDKVDFSDIYDPDTLLEEAKKYLQTCINLAITIELTAVDLHMIDVDINSIRLGDLVPCISTQHGIMSTFGDVSTYYLVSKYELDLENPTNNKITLGRTISTLTDKQVNDSVNLKAQISEVRTEMYNLPGLSLEPITNEVLEGILN